MALFSKLFARWIVEVDCGAIKQVEYEKISSGDFQKVQAGLKSTDKVSAVWELEFESKAVSRIDVETRLSAADLGAEIQKLAGGALALERGFCFCFKGVKVRISKRKERTHTKS